MNANFQLEGRVDTISCMTIYTLQSWRLEVVTSGAGPRTLSAHAGLPATGTTVLAAD